MFSGISTPALFRALLFVQLCAIGASLSAQTSPHHDDLVAPMPTDPIEKAARDKVGKQFNMQGAKPLDSGGPQPEVVMFVDHALLSPTPFSESDIVVRGEVVKSQTFFSEDRTGLYRELTVRVEEMLKNDARVNAAVGRQLLVVILGGAVRLSDGNVVARRVKGQGRVPLPGEKDVLFLSYNDAIDRFAIVTAWELKSGRVYPAAVHCARDEHLGGHLKTGQ